MVPYAYAPQPVPHFYFLILISLNLKLKVMKMYKSDSHTFSHRDVEEAYIFLATVPFSIAFNPSTFIQALFSSASTLLPLGQEGQSQGNRWPHRSAAFQCHFPEE